MVNFVSVAVFVAVCFVVCSNAKHLHDDDHHLHCHVDGHPEIHLHLGESTSLAGKCQKITCEDPDGDIVTTQGCPLGAIQGCKYTDIDYAKPYPDCCPQKIDC